MDDDCELGNDTITKLHYFLLVIHHNYNESSTSMAYNDLACLLSDDGSIRLLNGVEMTKKQLLLKAIELDPSNSLAYFNLANTCINKA